MEVIGRNYYLVLLRYFAGDLDADLTQLRDVYLLIVLLSDDVP